MRRTENELRSLVMDISASWQSRCFRVPGRFPDISAYLDAVGKGLLNSEVRDGDQERRIAEMDERQLAAELTRLRTAIDAAGEVQLQEWKPAARQIQKLLAIPGDDDDEE